MLLAFRIQHVLAVSVITGAAATIDSDSRPTFDAYTYKENEFCAEATYDNNATTIQEAVTKCSNDPNCAAIEDRFGDGKAPIGLCKKYKGKLSGSGSYLLRRGNNKLEMILRMVVEFLKNISPCKLT